MNAVRAADSPRVHDLLEDLAQVADVAALLLLRRRLYDDSGPPKAEPERAARGSRVLARDVAGPGVVRRPG